MRHDFVSHTGPGQRTERALLGMYAEGGRKRFTWKDICSRVDEGYAPGRIDFPVEKRDAINGCLEMMGAYGYVTLKKDRKEKAFTLYGGQFTEKMEDYCLANGVRTKRYMAGREILAIEKCGRVRDGRLAVWLERERRTGNFVTKTFPVISESGFPEKGFINAVKLADEILSFPKGLVYERDIAKKVLNNSKGITPWVRKTLERILSECADEEMLEAFEERKRALGAKAQILPLYGVVKTPEYIRTEGPMTITLTDGRKIETQGLPYAFSSEYLDVISSIRTDAARIVTIENLTSYEDFHGEGAVKVFTGGFLSFPGRVLLAKIYEGNPSAEYLHWSDIDCGGIRIFRQVKKYIPTVVPYRMDAATLKENREYWTGLTDNDRRYLLSCADDPLFSGLAGYMLENDAKLEQESIYA